LLPRSQRKSAGKARTATGRAKASATRKVAILHKNKGALDDADYTDMEKVTGYVHRHLAQGGPAEDKEHSRWRYSLMNWGHDPSKA
jgi:hypothetical protein